jgi:hypothetical protein
MTTWRSLSPGILLACVLVSRLNGGQQDVRSIAYATRFGGADRDVVADLVADFRGNLYFTGSTNSPDFPLKNALQPSIGGAEGTSAAFVAKLGSTGALEFSTYFGGSGNDSGSSLAVDQTGAVYVTGRTSSANLPTTTGVVQPAAACPNQSAWCAYGFLLKLDSQGRLLMSTYLGFGTTVDVRVAVDGQGNIYLGGTASARFDVDGRVLPGGASNASLAFVAKLRADGTKYEYVTFLNASEPTYVEAIAVDANGHAYVAGRGDLSCSFRATPGAFTTTRGCLFVASLSAEDGSIAWLSRFGGTPDGADYSDTPPAYISDMAVDTGSHVYITGATSNLDFPTTPNAAERALHVRRPGAYVFDGFDAFLAKFTADGSALVYSTFLGGSSADAPERLTVDAAGAAHVVGVTDSDDMAGRSYSISRNRDQLFCCWDVFAATANDDGSAISALTVFGGSYSDMAAGIAIDHQGRVWIAGTTYSPDFPVTPDAIDGSPRTGIDGFLARLPGLSRFP